MAIGTIGKYERLDVLGHGTSGVVYLAWDTLLRRQVALKEIRAAEPEWERILEEARVLDRLGRHPHIVHVNGVDHEAGAILIDMELVKGRNLAEVLRARNGEPLLPRDAVRIARAVLSALQYAHEKRIIHRDVKPANVLIGDDGQTVKLTDFGLAEALGTGSVAGGGGTYPYMAPEDFADDASSDYRSDLWAVGVVLYEMLSARRPFAVAARPAGSGARNASADPFAWKRVIENDTPPPLFGMRPGISRELDEVVRRALMKNKAARFADAQTFADALQAALRTLPDVPLSEQVTFTPTPFAVPDALADATVPPLPPTAPVQSAPPTQWETGHPFVLGGGATIAYTLDELLLGAAKHWDEGRAAFLDGRIERFLRSIGEVYIAELAGELSSRPGESEDKRFREFLSRSRADDTDEAAVYDNAEASINGTPHEDATLPFRTGRRLLRRHMVPITSVPPFAAPETVPASRSAAGQVYAAFPVENKGVSPADFSFPQAEAGQETRENTATPRWWFWPLFLLCLGPVAAAFQSLQSGHAHYSPASQNTALMSAWTASGFCAALLLLVGIGARFPLMARIVCGLPIVGGLVAAGALTAAWLHTNPKGDALVGTGVLSLVPLLILLFAAGSVVRLWKLWAWITVLCAVVGSGLFLLN